MKTKEIVKAIGKRKEEKTTRDMVEREAVITALKVAWDSFSEDVNQEVNEDLGEKAFYVRRGVILAIEVVKNVRGEWK